MARPKKPTGAKVLKGTFRKCRENPSEPAPMPVDGIPKPPKGLSRAARDEWNQIIEYVINNKIVGSEGLSSVEAYCRIHAAIKEERDILKVPASYLAQYRAFAGSLGLTGDSRAKINAPAKPKENKNPFEAFK